MHKRELRVHGASVDALPAALYSDMRAERKGSVERYEGNEFDVITVERYYLRNNSDQQATIILDQIDEETSLVTIFSGGGGAGLLQLSMGSHRTQTGKLASRIDVLCDSKELQLEVTN